MKGPMKTLFSFLKKDTRPGPLLSSLQEFIREQGASGIMLLLATLIALLWANSSFGDVYDHLWEMPISIGIGDWVLTHSLHYWINDGLMVVFFFVVGLEIKREVRVGELSRGRQALFPAVAALGGMVVPALIFLVFNANTPSAHGWAIPMATDIAFALGVLSLLGKSVPFALKVFLTAVAIVDDIGAVLVIALFYSDELNWIALALAGVVFMVLFIMNRLAVRNPLPYSGLGVVLWLAFLQSGVHATIAGVLLASMIPTNPRIDGESFLRRSRGYLDKFEKAGEPGKSILTNREQRAAVRELERGAESVTSPLQRLEHALHPWVAYAIMPIFALANAGLRLPEDVGASLTAPVGLGVLLGLVLGKQIGITLFAWFFDRIGVVDKPRGLHWGHIYGAAWLGGIGFTMALFITNLAFSDATRIEAAKLGILAASLVSALGAAVVLRSMRSTQPRD
jgi:NhaA family Na+:H+ antiporter